ncbi:MAG: ATP-binding protein [Oscillospiraceae bacterium]|nr:ATP-binding protein [Oscillospiraceae bacterium]
MAYDGKLLAKARGKLEEIKAENQAEHNRRLSLIYSRIPEIHTIDERMRRQMTELVRITISRKGDVREQIKKLENENLDLQMRKAELLTAAGFPTDYMEDIYSCRLCKDSGVYEGGVCSCLEKLYNQALTEELGVLLKNGDECFEKFRLDLYPEDARDTMSIVYESCRKFAENFPDVSSNLLLQGGTGLGKTYLSACIARVVAKKGLSVCYDTAAAALDSFERQKFSRNPEDSEAASLKVQRMLSCDLMILDDLGTEMVTPISISALYTLINTRLASGKKTIISTNYSMDELQRKYSPQICSRIEGEFLRLPFVGKDIRLIKKGV